MVAGAFATLPMPTLATWLAASISKPCPALFLVPLTSNKERASPDDVLVAAAQSMVVKNMGTLVLVPRTKLDRDTQLADFGMESILAAESRLDMFHAFEVGALFAVLLDRRTSVGALSESVGKGLIGAIEMKRT